MAKVEPPVTKKPSPREQVMQSAKDSSSLISAIPGIFQNSGDFSQFYEVGSTYEVAPDLVADNPHNSRHFLSRTKFDELRHSIETEGQKDPIPVYLDKSGKLIQKDGKTRKRILKELNRDIKILVVAPPEDAVELALESFTRNKMRADETILDEAYAFASYKTTFSPEEFKAIALKRGWTPPQQSRLSDIARLPKQVCQYCVDFFDEAGKQPLVTLRTLAALASSAKQGASEETLLALAKSYGDKEITAIELADAAKEVATNPTSPKKSAQPLIRTTADLKIPLQATQGKGHLYSYPSGRIKLDFSTKDGQLREKLLKAITAVIDEHDNQD